ncbi:MAG: hypothetical protein Q7J98_14455 [Kiritimatiellia bacterium]|nr:hypothetical protein [Kiritimatiellia bacterium]
MMKLIALMTAICIPVFICPAEQTIYPGSVDISDFSTAKVIYKPGENIRFQVAFIPWDNHETNSNNTLDIQVWVEREMDTPFLATSLSAGITNGRSHNLVLNWNGDKDVFGHRAWVRFSDAQGRLLAEKDTLFDVAADWIHVMRLYTEGAKNLANETVSDEQIAANIKVYREAYINAVEMYTFSPKPYYLAPKEDIWPYQYGKQEVQKERLQAWSRELHRQGLKYIAYNETSAAEGPDEWKFYLKDVSMEKPCAAYFADKGMFVPNALKIAAYFADQMGQSVKMFGWDGLLMDSAIHCYIQTSKGVTKEGKPVTDLTPGEIGYQYLQKAHKAAREINPDFRFLSQNATSISHKGVKEAPENIYPWIIANAKKLNIRRYSELVDLYTLEIDAHNEPRDGRYPLTYEKMSLTLNSIIEVTRRPLMAWAMLAAPFYTEYSIASLRPYMALLLASRTHIHDHFLSYGGPLSRGKNSPVSKQFVLYNRFLTRFSYYIFDPELRWVVNAKTLFKVTGSRPLFWDKLVYERPLAGGGKRWVIHLLNLPPNGTILDQTEIPDPVQNVELMINKENAPARIACMDADDMTLKPLALVKAGETEQQIIYHIPPVVCWKIIVVEQ